MPIQENERTNRTLPAAGPAWHALAAEDVLTRTHSAPAGLSAREAAERLASQGRNQLVEGESIRAHQILLIFSELLRSFGARSDARPIWRIPFFTNPNLALEGVKVVRNARKG